MPERIQQRRTKGWRKPENTVSVARPSKWGNPYRVGGLLEVKSFPDEGRFLSVTRQTARITPHLAVLMYRHLWLTTWTPNDYPSRAFLDVRELAGKNLMCFCPLDQPCHADVLLELANRASDG